MGFLEAKGVELPVCLRHPEAGVGRSAEHVFCLYDPCSWEEELCWDMSSGSLDYDSQQDIRSSGVARCFKRSGHVGEHFGYDDEDVPASWEKESFFPPSQCSMCGTPVQAGSGPRCALCETRMARQQLATAFAASAKSGTLNSDRCRECGTDLMGRLGSLCTACKKSNGACAQCGQVFRGTHWRDYCASCSDVVKMGGTPDP